RQVLRQGRPLAARPQNIEDRVQDLADIDFTVTPAVLGRWDQGRDQRPLRVRQITRIAQAVPLGGTAVFGLPHRAPLGCDSGARQRITTDSSDSTTSWIGSKHQIERGANGSIREKVSLDHIHIRPIDVGQKARVEIDRDHSSAGTDPLREPSRYRATSCTDLAASPTLANRKLSENTACRIVDN